MIMVPLRLCYLIIDCFFNEHCDLPDSPIKDFTDTVTSGFNISLVRKAASLVSSGNEEGKDIDDCLHSIQANESDVVLMPYTMPVMLSNVKTGPVFFSDKIQILSTYKVDNHDSTPGIFATFDAFDVNALSLILNFFVILVVLISLTYILERKSLSRRIRIKGRRFKLRFVPWFIFRFFVKQYPSLPGNMTALKLLLTCCLLTFSFFVTFFYSSMIKTDMVTVKAPLVIASYQDIVDDPAIEPYIRHNFDEYKSFKNAPSGSLKKKIWERVVKMGVGKLVFDSNYSTPFEDTKHPFMNYEGVIMGYSSIIKYFKYYFAVHFKSLKTRKGLYVSDPTDSAKVSAIVMNRMTLKTVSEKYERRMKRFFQGHFWHKMVDNAGLHNARFFAGKLKLGKDLSDADQYVSQRVVLSEPVLLKPNMTYFMYLFISYLVLCFIQFIVFLIERWVSNKNKNRILPGEDKKVRPEQRDIS